MYYVYILKSAKFSKTYTGITPNLPRRLKQHNSGYHKYTKTYLPWIIFHQEEFETRALARKREKYLKSAAGRKWMKRVLFDNISAYT